MRENMKNGVKRPSGCVIVNLSRENCQNSLDKGYIKIIEEQARKAPKKGRRKNMDELNEKCCFCGKEIAGLGNNPAPVKEDGSNENAVIPARLVNVDDAQIEANDLFRSIVYTVLRLNLDGLREVWNFVSGEDA